MAASSAARSTPSASPASRAAADSTSPSSLAAADTARVAASTSCSGTVLRANDGTAKPFLDSLRGAESRLAGVEPVAVDLRDYVTFDLAGAAGRRVVATDVLAVDVVCLEPRQSLPARTFPSADAVYTVLGGRTWVVTDEAEVTLAALQSVLIPAGVPHGLRNDSADPLILQVVVSPPDEAPVLPAGPADEAVAESADSIERRRAPLSERLRRVLGG